MPDESPRIQWPQSITVNLAIAAVIGFCHALFMMGPGPLNPRNVSWLSADPATYYIGWSLFRQDPHLHWPLLYTERIGYPLGDSIAFMDPIPWLALIFKAMSALLPTPFQYLGIAAILACAFQFFFGTLLFRMLLGRNFCAVLLPGLFFLFAPTLNWRFVGHYALAQHWLILAAFCLFIALQRIPPHRIRQSILWSALLGFISVGVNLYLALMVAAVIATGVAAALWRKRFTVPRGMAVLFTFVLACLASALALGLIRGGGGYEGTDYGSFSMNLLAPFDPREYSSLIVRPMPWASRLQDAGFNYLGTGLLALVLMLIPSFPFSRLRRFTRADVVPVAAACLLFTLLAASTKVTLGSFVVANLDPRGYLAPYLGIFHASGRLFWPVYYAITTAILVAAFTVWKPNKAAVLAGLALVVQASDLLPFRLWIQANLAVPKENLLAPQWATVGRQHANLIVLPAYECDPTTPGGRDGYRIFGLLAVNQHMKTNSYYAARYSRPQMAYHCWTVQDDIARKPLDPDSAYVVSPNVASTISVGPSGPGRCHTLDGFILCSAKTDFGLGPGTPVTVPLMYESGRITSWTDAVAKGYLLGGWNYSEPTLIWNRGDGVLQFRLSQQQQIRYRSIGLKLAFLIAAQKTEYKVQLGSFVASGEFAGAAQPRTEVAHVDVPISAAPDGVQTIHLISSRPVRPIDIGLSEDFRLLGVALMGVELTPKP